MPSQVNTKVVLASGLAICLSALTLCAAGWQWALQEKAAVEAGVKLEIATAAHTAILAPGSLSQIRRRLWNSLYEVMQNDPSIRSICITDGASGRSTLDSPLQAQSPPDLFLDLFNPIPAYESISGNIVFSASPISGLGKFRAGLDLSEVASTVSAQAEGFFEACLGASVLGLAILYFLVSCWVKKPAEAIINVAKRISDGDQNLRLAVTSNDEFGQIMTAFNELTDTLLTTQAQADTDGLTQVYNHRYLQEKIEDTISYVERLGHSMAIMLLDLNKFKLLNDTYGHLAGDHCLRQTAQVLRRAIHLEGIVGRYGGDEFLIILPNVTRERAEQMCRRTRLLINTETFRPHPLASSLPIAFSLGLAVYPENGVTPKELIAYADASLYAEKRGGYNLVELTRAIEAEYEHIQLNRTKVIGFDDAQPEGGLFATLFSLVVAIDKKDSYTKQHSEHVAAIAVLLARAIGLQETTQRALQVAGLLHDVGKIGVPDSILLKPGKLTQEEFDIMKGHVSLAERLIQEVPYQEEVLEAVRYHHERWDGKGYPHHTAGTQTPELGRLMGVVDAYSAMSLHRAYRRAMPFDDVLVQMRAGAGTQFDPGLVEPFIDVLEFLRAANQTELIAPADAFDLEKKPLTIHKTSEESSTNGDDSGELSRAA